MREETEETIHTSLGSSREIPVTEQEDEEFDRLIAVDPKPKTPTIPELKERLRLARIRDAEMLEAVVPVTAEIASQVKAFEEVLNSKFVGLFDAAVRSREELAAADTALRAALVKWYDDEGKAAETKQFDDQLGVKVTTILEYAPAEALAWAKDNALFVVQLDTKAFEKLPNLEKIEIEDKKLVSKKETVIAVVPKNLK